MKYITIGLFVLLILSAGSAGLLYEKYSREKSDRIRLQENIKQISQENAQKTTLILKEKELSGKYLHQRDSIANLLKITPKTITKIVEREVKQIEYDTVSVEVDKYTDISWSISDQDKCWLWKADAKLENEDLIVDRTFFSYDNKTTDVYYKKLKWKFLFIKVYDKNKLEIKSISKCGGETVKTIEIIKNK